MAIVGFIMSLHLPPYMEDIDETQGQEGTSVGKVLATQALEPGIHLQFPFTKMTYTCNPSAGEWTQEDLQCSLASQPVLMGELQAGETPYAKKQVEQFLKNDTVLLRVPVL